LFSILGKNKSTKIQYEGLGVPDLQKARLCGYCGCGSRNRSIASLARPKYTGAPNLGYSRAMFHVAVETIMGDETTTKFWTDRWLHGPTDEDLAPNLVTLVPKEVLNH